jgi:hypothetical protein
MTEPLHHEVAVLLDEYRRDLRETRPSEQLDARIDRLVAGVRKNIPPPARRRWSRLQVFAAAAGVAVVAIAAGILIGMGISRGTPGAHIARDATLLPADFSLWPADSVALQIPAEYSAQGKLVAVDPNSRSNGKRYRIDVVVSNDGTIRIDRIEPTERNDEITLQTP